jgi:hypothetical protein
VIKKQGVKNMLKQNEVTKKKIGENTFYIRPFPAFVAANISGELTQVLAPVLSGLAPLLNAGNNGDGDGDGEPVNRLMETNLDDALPAFSNALSSLSGDKFEHLMRRLLVENKNISVSGELTSGEAEWLDSNLADEIFCGELQDMFILCFEVIKINFSGFFKKIAGRFGNLQDVTLTKKTQSKSGESST